MVKKINVVCRIGLLLAWLIFSVGLSACDDSSSIFNATDSASTTVKNDLLNSSYAICNQSRSSAVARNMIRVGFDWPPNATKINILRDGNLVSSTTDTSLTSLIDTQGLREGQTYRYTCEALIDGKYYAGKQRFDIYTLTTQAPTFTGIGFASPSGPHSVSVAWQPVGESGVVADYFLIYEGLDNSSFSFANAFAKKKVFIGSYSTEMTGLGDELPYIFGVRACTINDICDSNVVTLRATTLDEPLSPLTTGATSVALSNFTATITTPWTETQGAVSKRMVYIKKSAAPGDFTASVPPTADTFDLKQTFTMSDLSQPTTALTVDSSHFTFQELYTYWFYVVDEDPAGKNNATIAKTHIVAAYAADMTPPSDPTGVTLAIGTPANSQMILSWNALSRQIDGDNNGVSRYEIYTTSAPGIGTPANPCTSTTRTKIDVDASTVGAPPTYISYPINSLPERTSFRACLVAFDSAGNSSNPMLASETITTQDFTPPTPWSGIDTITYNGQIGGKPSLKVKWLPSTATDISTYKITLWKTKSGGTPVPPASYVKVPVFVNYTSGVLEAVILDSDFSVTDYDEIAGTVDACDNAAPLYNTVNVCTTPTLTATLALPDTNPPLGFYPGIQSVVSNAQGQVTVSWLWNAGLQPLQMADYAGYLIYTLAPGITAPDPATLSLTGITPTIVHCPSGDACATHITTSSTITGLVPWKHYTFHVRAFDHAYTTDPLKANITNLDLDSNTILTVRVKDTDSATFPSPALDVGSDFVVKWAPGTDNSLASGEPDAVLTYLVYRKSGSDFTSYSDPAAGGGTLIASLTKQPSNYDGVANRIRFADTLGALTEATAYYYTVCVQDAAMNTPGCLGFSKTQTVTDNTPPTIFQPTGQTLTQPAPDGSGNFSWTIAWHAHDCVKNATQCGDSGIAPFSQDSTSPGALTIIVKRTITDVLSHDFTNAVSLQGVGGHDSTKVQSTTADETSFIADPTQRLSALKGNQKWVNYQVLVRDLASLTSTAEMHVRVDAVPPAVPSALTIQNPLAKNVGNINNPTVRVTVAGLIDGDKVKLYSDPTCSAGSLLGTSAAAVGTPAYLDVPVSTVLSVPGSYTFRARSMDLIGNESACSTVSVNYYFENSALLVTGLADDTNPTQAKGWAWDCNRAVGALLPCTYRFAIDNSATWTASGSYAATSIAATTGAGTDNGVDYYLHVQAQDQAGNTSLVTTVKATIDRVAPTAATIVAQWNSAALSQPHATASLTASWVKSVSPANATGLVSQKVQYYKDSTSTACQAGKELSQTNINNATAQTDTISITPYAGSSTYYSYQVASLDYAGNSALSPCSSVMLVRLPPPVVSSVSPNWGAKMGGSNLTITGTDFINGATVSLGGASCSSVTFVSSTQLTCTTTTSGTAGLVSATVTNPDTQAGSLSNAFNFIDVMRVSKIAPGREYHSGNYSTCAVISGGVQCWGANNYGQLGLGSTSGPLYSPSTVSGLSAGVTDVATGSMSACAIVNSGVKCWGYNGNYELGTGSQTNSFTPVTTIAPSSGVTAISAYASEFCAIVNGGIKCWGSDSSRLTGQTPVDIVGLTSGVTDLSVGSDKVCAIKSGALYCINSGEANASVAFGLTSGVTAVALDVGAGCVVKNNAMYCWGAMLGGGFSDGSLTAIGAPLNAGVSKISLFWPSACGITNGSLYCFGANTTGGIGNGSTAGVSYTTPFKTLSGGVTDVQSGINATCALQNGAPWCWGRNTVGEAGTGTAGSSYTPTQVVGMLGGLQELGKGSRIGIHMCAVYAGKVNCWGFNWWYMVDSSGINRAAPVQVSGLPLGASKVAQGYQHTCALINGEVWCWGDNSAGQLGTGNYSPAPGNLPVKVPGLTNVTDIIAEQGVTCAIANGGVKCWGMNGWTGSNSPGNLNVPTDVINLGPGSGARELVTYSGITLAVLKDGQLWNWANGPAAQVASLGNELSASRNQGPTLFIKNGALIDSNQTVINSVSTGMSAVYGFPGLGFGCGIANGYPICWGGDPWARGFLGDGNLSVHSLPANTTAQVIAPANMGGADLFTFATQTSCAAVGASVYCWGQGTAGVLGSNFMGDTATPRLVNPFQ